LVLQIGSEGEARQSLLPFIRKRGVVAVATPDDHPSELRRHAQGMFEDVGGHVVAIDQDGDTSIAL
jgi:hypothetical protein